jgi:hypothetical protein
VNVACSLASLAIITVLTKENAVQVGVFSNDKIVQVMKMVLLGMLATSAVSILVWPATARTELRENCIKAMDSFGDMLTMITRGFLSGSETDLQSPAFNYALSRYKSVFTQLTKNLKESKLEHYVLGTENEHKLEAKLVTCLQKLAQAIGGLRSAAITQFALLRETGGVGNGTPMGSTRSISEVRRGSALSTWDFRQDRFAELTAIEEASEDDSGASVKNMSTVRTPAEIFSRFISHLGPPMKSLCYTLSRILNQLPFGPAPDYSITINEHFMENLTDAL